jgi:hypothetical protein
MNKEFVPYEEALALKELGFDEPCLAWFSDRSIRIVGVNGCALSSLPVNSNFNGDDEFVTAPLYQQAFRWFRKEHNLRSFVDTRVYDVDSPNQWIYDFQIKMGNGVDTQPFYSGDFDSYEEAELACLKKLIEIVKNNE